MSSKVPYDYQQFRLERSRNWGGSEAGYHPVQVASFTWTSSYTEDDLGTLLLEAETAQATISYWDGADLPLQVGDEARAFYGARLLFHGTVESTSLDVATDTDAHRYGKTRKVTLTATLAGDYANSLVRIPISRNGVPPIAAYQRLVWLGTVENAESEADPQVQTWAQGAPKLESGSQLNVMEELRSLSSLMFTPLRFTGANQIALVNPAEEPALPTGFGADEGPELYTGITYEAERAPHWIYLVGTGVDSIG